jgi:hypothetical protein
MTFAQLLLLKNQLENLSFADVMQQVSARFDLIQDQIYRADSIFEPDQVATLFAQHAIIQKGCMDFEAALSQYKLNLGAKIVEQSTHWFQKSHAQYEQLLQTGYAQHPESVGMHRNKKINLPGDLETQLRARVAKHTNWKHPAMCIHPMCESFVDDMVAGDPLYLIDESQTLLDPTRTRFGEIYQNRLRLYTIQESFDSPMLQALPDKQFGFCLVYNYLNYRPFELIKKYLEEIYAKLLPGGILAMTYNDCDLHSAIQMVEQNITCYTPGTLIRGWAQYLGYEETFVCQDLEPTVWLELKKPGTMTSLRGGQTMAQILPKSIAESK